MEPEMNGVEIGQQLGVESAEATITKVEAYCEYEKQRPMKLQRCRTNRRSSSIDSGAISIELCFRTPRGAR